MVITVRMWYLITCSNKKKCKTSPLDFLKRDEVKHCSSLFLFVPDFVTIFVTLNYFVYIKLI